MVTSKKMTMFLQEMVKLQSKYPILQEIQNEGREAWAPILPAESANFIYMITKMAGAQRILEIGTSIGYSTIVFCKAMGPSGRISTIEIDEGTIQKAKENFIKAGVEDQVTVFPGDAKEIVPYIQGCYDLIFMDGPKSHYESFLPFLLSALREGGVLLCDNVLFHGMISGDRKVRGRKITIVKRMRSFLDTLSNHPHLDSSVVPIGDGISISIKRKGKDA